MHLGQPDALHAGDAALAPQGLAGRLAALHQQQDVVEEVRAPPLPCGALGRSFGLPQLALAQKATVRQRQPLGESRAERRGGQLAREVRDAVARALLVEQSLEVRDQLAALVCLQCEYTNTSGRETVSCRVVRAPRECTGYEYKEKTAEYSGVRVLSSARWSEHETRLPLLGSSAAAEASSPGGHASHDASSSAYSAERESSTSTYAAQTPCSRPCNFSSGARMLAA